MPGPASFTSGESGGQHPTSPGYKTAFAVRSQTSTVSEGLQLPSGRTSTPVKVNPISPKVSKTRATGPCGSSIASASSGLPSAVSTHTYPEFIKECTKEQLYDTLMDICHVAQKEQKVLLSDIEGIRKNLRETECSRVATKIQNDQLRNDIQRLTAEKMELIEQVGTLQKMIEEGPEGTTFAVGLQGLREELVAKDGRIKFLEDEHNRLERLVNMYKGLCNK